MTRDIWEGCEDCESDHGARQRAGERYWWFCGELDVELIHEIERLSREGKL